MSKKITFKGMLAIGLQDRIKLSTLNGKTGYRITKFQTISNRPGQADSVTITTITKANDSVDLGINTINLTNPGIVAVAFNQNGSSSSEPFYETIIMDNEVFNQDIFITAGDADSGTIAVNYYIELETVELSDIQSTKLTLQSIRTITSQ